MSTLTRWLTAQTDATTGSSGGAGTTLNATPETPVKPEEPPKAELKQLKKPSTFETPSQVEYTDNPAITEAMKVLADLRKKIDEATDMATEIVKEAKASSTALLKDVGEPEMRTKLDSMVAPLRDELVKLAGESSLMLRQANGLIIVLQRVRGETTEMPNMADKLKWVTDKLLTLGDVGQKIVTELNEYSTKIKSVTPANKDMIYMYPKPKLVKNQAQSPAMGQLTDLFNSAGRALSGALTSVRQLASEIDEAVRLLGTV